MTFFSGTDIATLQSEGNSRNNFVSLIVNNKGLYSAAITRKITLNQGTSNLFDKEATNINYGISIIQAFKLNVVIENSNFSKLKQVLNQLKQSKKPITPINTYNKNNQHPSLTPNTEVNKKDTSIKKPILKTSKLDDEVISLMYQLITGSIVINHNSNINIKDWILKLPTIYSKRFKNMKDFEYWIELYSEYLFFNIEDDISGEKMPKYATMILEELENYATNTYLDYIKFILHSYIDFNYADE